MEVRYLQFSYYDIPMIILGATYHHGGGLEKHRQYAEEAAETARQRGENMSAQSLASVHGRSAGGLCVLTSRGRAG